MNKVIPVFFARGFCILSAQKRKAWYDNNIVLSRAFQKEERYSFTSGGTMRINVQDEKIGRT